MSPAPILRATRRSRTSASFGHSRDQRRDCVQVVIALVLTPDGFPLAYEVMPGNTSDNTTLADFLTKIEDPYGRSDRVWIMDRGIPTEEILETMREGDAAGALSGGYAQGPADPARRSPSSLCLGNKCANRSMSNS